MNLGEIIAHEMQFPLSLDTAYIVSCGNKKTCLTLSAKEKRMQSDEGLINLITTRYNTALERLKRVDVA